MAGYVYRCGTCGPWEVHRPIGTADVTSSCPTCGLEGRRLYTAPVLNRASRPAAEARLREEASADVPTVTTAVPPRARRPAPADPRWSTLPRP
jgi:putative FmdB family regulatory protein